MIVYFEAVKAYNLKHLSTLPSGDVLPMDQSFLDRVNEGLKFNYAARHRA
jgi:hypothetical protein